MSTPTTELPAMDLGVNLFVGSPLREVDPAPVVQATPGPSAGSASSSSVSPTVSEASFPNKTGTTTTTSATGTPNPEAADVPLLLETPEAAMNPTTFELPEYLATDPDAIRQRNVYVAGLPLDFGACHFTQLMEQFGKIVTCRFIDDNRRAVRAQRAYGFVLYECPAVAVSAVAALKEVVIEGNAVTVRLSDNGVVKPPPPPKEKRAGDDGSAAKKPRKDGRLAKPHQQQPHQQQQSTYQVSRVGVPLRQSKPQPFVAPPMMPPSGSVGADGSVNPRVVFMPVPMPAAPSQWTPAPSMAPPPPPPYVTAPSSCGYGVPPMQHQASTYPVTIPPMMPVPPMAPPSCMFGTM